MTFSRASWGLLEYMLRALPVAERTFTRRPKMPSLQGLCVSRGLDPMMGDTGFPGRSPSRFLAAARAALGTGYVAWARLADDLFLVRTRLPATSRVLGLSPCLLRVFILVSRIFPLLRTGLSPRRSCE